MRRKRLSQDQHRDLAPRLKALRAELFSIQGVVCANMPLADRTIDRARRAVKAIDELRSILDDEACAIGMDHHGLYYGIATFEEALEEMAPREVKNNCGGLHG